MAFDIGQFFSDLVNPNSNTARDARNVIAGIPLIGAPAAWQLGQWGYGTKGDNAPNLSSGVSAPAPSFKYETGFSHPVDPTDKKKFVPFVPDEPQQFTPNLPPLSNTPLPSYQDALSQAKSLLSSSGWDPGFIDVDSISWNPLRKDAKSRASDYDAKVAAMYKALQNSVRTDDAQAIKDNFAQNMGAVKGSTDDTVNALQQAAAAANDANVQNLQALGLGDAAERIINSGRDANTRASQNVADALARGQVAQDAVSRKQQASGDYNTQMAGAYGLQGAETRDNIQDQLSALLANYSMAEQQARAAAQEKNASLKQNQQSVLQNIANQVLGNKWNQVKYNDSLQQQRYQDAMNQFQQFQQQQQAQAQQAAEQAARQQAMGLLQNLLLPEDQGGKGFDMDNSVKYANGLNAFNKFLN